MWDTEEKPSKDNKEKKSLFGKFPTRQHFFFSHLIRAIRITESVRHETNRGLATSAKTGLFPDILNVFLYSKSSVTY